MPKSKVKPRFRFDPAAASGPATRYRKGNLLVQQVRSRIGRNSDQIAALASLGLGVVGRSATCDIHSPAVREQLEILDFMLAVAPLSLDAVTLAGEEPRAPDLEASSPKSAKVGARRLVLSGGDDRAEIEIEDGNLTILWSSALPAATTFSRLLADHAQPSGEVVAIKVGSRSVDRPAADEFLERLGSAPAHWSFIRLTFGDAQFYWEPAIYPRHVNEGVDPGRVGIVTAVGSPLADSLPDLITQTGTPAIASNSSAIAHAVASMDDG